MNAKQLSVFIENRQGRLGEVLDVLKRNDINIISLSLADTTEYGLLRLIVSDPVKGREALSQDGFSTMLTDVLVIKIEHKAGSLRGLLKILGEKQINIEYMYGLSIDGERAYVVLKPSDLRAAGDILETAGVKTVSAEEIAKLN